MHFAGNYAEGLRSKRQRCEGYIPIYENIPKTLLYLSPKSCHNFSGSRIDTVGA